MGFWSKLKASAQTVWRWACRVGRALLRGLEQVLRLPQARAAVMEMARTAARRWSPPPFAKPVVALVALIVGLILDSFVAVQTS